MRAALILLAVFGPLAVAASNLDRSSEGDIIGIQDGPATPTPDPSGDGTSLYERWPQLGSTPVNRTEGVIRGEKRQPKNLVEARQNTVSAWFDLCRRR